jgi:PAS domain S-box-containing protein
MSYKNWREVIRGRAQIIIIYAIIVLSIILTLGHILKFPHLLFKTLLIKVEWLEIVIGIIVVFSVGSIAIILIHYAESKRRKAEETLRESEEKYKALIEAAGRAGEGIIIIQDSGEGEAVFVFVNDRFCRMSGYSMEELLGRSPWDLVPHEISVRLENWYKRRHMGESLTSHYEAAGIRKDGTIVPLELSIVTMPWQGKIATALYLRDVTERKQMEEALRESEERLRQLAENIDQVFWLTDWENNKLLYVNPSYEKLFGRSCQSAYEDRLSWYQVIHPGDRAPVRELLIKNAKLGQSTEVEYRIVRGDGAMRWILDRNYPIRDKHGKVYRIVSIAEDITERKRAEEALRESEERFRGIIENAPFGYYRVGKDGLWQFVNPVWERMHGFSLEEVVGKSFEITQTEDAVEKAREYVQRSLAGETITGEFSRLTKNGSIEYHSFNIQPVRQGEEIVAIEGFINDITERKRAEELLRENEERFLRIFEEGPLGMAIVGQNFRYIKVNEAFCRMTGHTEQELTSLTFVDITHPEHVGKDTKYIKKLIAGEIQLYRTEKRYVRKDKAIMWISATATTIHDKDGQFLYILGMFEDITERKKAEEALRESEEKYRTLFETMLQGVVYQDRTGRITSANLGAEAILGLTSEQMLGRTSSDPRWKAIHEDGSDFPGETHPSMVALKTGKPVRNEMMGVFHPQESRYHWIVINAIPQFKPGEDTPYQVYTTFSDITERRKAEEAMRESEQRYKGVVDNIGIGVSLISPNMEILFLNNQMKKWFPNIDISKEAVCYRAFNNPPKEEVCSYCPTYKTLRDGHVHESTTETPLGERIVNYRVVSSPIKGKDGKVISAIEMMEDITERKKLQEQLIQTEKLAAVGTLAYGIAHEFNNIMAGILINSELGLATGDPEQIKECFQTIAENSQRASSITNNLLAFARQKEARKELVDITEPLRNVLSIIHRELEKHNIEMVEKFKPIPKIFCDAGQFSEVFLNMITNARDAMLPKGGTLTVEVEPYEDNIRIIFKDTGCGIPDEIKGRIFEAFVTTKGALGGSEVPGTGLGLFLTYGIVDGYQGRIEVESRVGQGTQFTILIPVTKNLPRKRLLDTVIKTPEDIAKRLKILLVDDEKAISSSLRKFLKSKGHQVTASLRAKEGLELFKKDKFDLVLSDITIPDMDGIELIKKMRKEDKDAKIIVITGHILKEKEEKAKEAGADEVLIKPFRNEVLCSAISKVLTGM